MNKTEQLNKQLFTAIEKNEIDKVRRLIDAGANVEAKGQGEWTPLHAAAWYGHTDIASLLISNGASVNVRDREDWGPLHAAASNGHTETAALLIKEGANIAAQSRTGRTPLSLARESGKDSAEMLALLALTPNSMDTRSAPNDSFRSSVIETDHRGTFRR